MRSWITRCLLAALATLPAGCLDAVPRDLGLQDPEPPPAGATWPYWPTHLRIHPLTRLAPAPDSTSLVIEARVEFFDADDHTTRGVGRVRFALHEAGRSPELSLPIASWIHDLRDAAVNERHFDDVTRTYLFRLEIDASQVSEPVDLYAFFVSATGQALRVPDPLRIGK
ncbi:MAG: hypothetical protein ACYTG1_02665 [Planctomycetota bacterium]|jgi:hypothetical protein